MTHDEITAAAFHESGHAIAIVTAFREAAWLPYPAPLMPVRYVEIIDDGGGNCVGSNIYSVAWDISVITPRYRPLMDAQTCVHLAGGVAEAIHRGVGGGGRDLLRYAEAHCQIDGDLQRAADVLADLRRLTGYDLYPMHYADRTLEMLLDHWPAVTALAEAWSMSGASMAMTSRRSSTAACTGARHDMGERNDDADRRRADPRAREHRCNG